MRWHRSLLNGEEPATRVALPLCSAPSYSIYVSLPPARGNLCLIFRNDALQLGYDVDQGCLSGYICCHFQQVPYLRSPNAFKGGEPLVVLPEVCAARTTLCHSAENPPVRPSESFSWL